MMFKKLAKEVFSAVFLFIFFAKMSISVAPVLFGNLDEESVYSVIMQLEIEHQSPKGPEGKWEDILTLDHFNFCQPLIGLSQSKIFTFQDRHVQSFYPPVPTPPPNA